MSAMVHHKCVICYKDLERNGSVNKSSNTGDSGNDCRTVKDQLSVIFFLRKFINIPQDICMKLLKEHGNPSLWISWCHSCSKLVEKAKDVFHQLEVLQNQATELKTELQNAVISAELEKCSTRSQNADEDFSKDFSTEIVRSYILLESDFTLIEGTDGTSEEFNDEECIDKITSDANTAHSTSCLAETSKILYDEDETMRYVTKIEVDDENVNFPSMETYKPPIVTTNNKNPSVSFSTSVKKDNRSNQTNSNCTKIKSVTHDGIERICFVRRDQSSAMSHNNSNSFRKAFQVAMELKCEICGKCFTSRSNKHSHKSSVHEGKKRKKIPCHLCNKLYASNNMKKHLQTHSV